MSTNKNTVIASSPTLDGLKKLMSNFFYSEITIADNMLFNSKGLIDGYTVRKKRNGGYQVLMLNK